MSYVCIPTFKCVAYFCWGWGTRFFTMCYGLIGYCTSSVHFKTHGMHLRIPFSVNCYVTTDVTIKIIDLCMTSICIPASKRIACFRWLYLRHRCLSTVRNGLIGYFTSSVHFKTHGIHLCIPLGVNCRNLSDNTIKIIGLCATSVFIPASKCIACFRRVYLWHHCLSTVRYGLIGYCTSSVHFKTHGMHLHIPLGVNCRSLSDNTIKIIGLCITSICIPAFKRIACFRWLYLRHRCHTAINNRLTWYRTSSICFKTDCMFHLR